ncbi:MAG TPA: transglycosylase domain-containing protein, partial [Acidimicrobiales bacterium]|nr:transglycosylase domain-containing protein [Acidimicrobiales bacterium]
DQRFYSHKGVDSRGLLRALRVDVERGSYAEGASTITQQYVRLAYTQDHSPTLARKIREAALARRLEREMSKDEILHHYLSAVYLGGGAYGVGAAAESYFRTPVQDLTLSQSALLAGMLPAPAWYDPRTNPAEAELQRRLVLEKMRNQGRITHAEYQEALPQRVVAQGYRPADGEQVTLVHPLQREEVRFPYFSDYVRRYLVARYGEEVTYRGGLRVETSLDPSLQAKAEATVAATLEGTEAPLEMSLVSLDPATGQVKAVVGGRDFSRSQVNLALGNCPAGAGAEPDKPMCLGGGGAGRQPGSAFKPFTLAKAYEQGIGPDNVYRGPGIYRFPNCRGPGCTVHNVESGGYGRLSLAQATARSVNTVFAQLVQDVGVKETAEMAHRLGLTMVNPDGNLHPGQPYGPSLTLGAAEVSPLDMAAAYGVFAARGMQFPTTPVIRVTDSDGRVLEDNGARPGQRVLPQAVADNVTATLKEVLAFGTGRRADIGRPDGAAGKTGTSEDAADAWFVGYTPTLSTAVWMGYADARRSLYDIKGVPVVYGGTLPAQAWHDFTLAALDGTPPADFPAAEPLPSQASSTAVRPAPAPAAVRRPSARSAAPVITARPRDVPEVTPEPPRSPTPVPAVSPPAAMPAPANRPDLVGALLRSTLNILTTPDQPPPGP